MYERNNAAIRENVCSDIYELGVKQKKETILDRLGKDIALLHEQCNIHIHDLDTFGDVNNCSIPLLKHYLLEKEYALKDDICLIAELFNRQKELIIEIGTSQSGGIGFNNYDIDLGAVLDTLNIEINGKTKAFIDYSIKEFLEWINITKTRCCREPYYITLNIGLAKNGWGKIIAESILDSFYVMPMNYTRPNLVFKLVRDVHFIDNAPCADLFEKAIKCTGRRMIPTYLLMDSSVNNEYLSEEIGIMGCRTRVVANINGKRGSNGRGNLGNVSINLPRIALECKTESDFFERLSFLLDRVHEILDLRIKMLKESKGYYVKYVIDNKLWNKVNTIDDMIKEGTLSVGYIGLSEAVEILTGCKYYLDSEAYNLALKIITYMRDYTDRLTQIDKINYSLLASPGEMISGRFCEYDKKLFSHSVHEKGFYTNSFHVEVDSGLSIFEKIDREAPFHRINNGGCITYVEFKEAVLENLLAIKDLLIYALEKNLSYVGVNYPLDVCNECGNIGTFDFCSNCGSDNIKRIRRVSGYLEDLEFFTDGKKAEVKYRKANI